MTQRTSVARQRLEVALQPAVHRLAAAEREARALRRRAFVCGAGVRAALGTAALVLLLWVVGIALPGWLPFGLLVVGLGVAAVLLVPPAPGSPSVAAAAAACDRAHGNHDRLAAAHQFAGEPAGDPASLHEQFVRAAIEDGLSSLQRVDAGRVLTEPTPEPASPARLCAAMLLVGVLPWLLPDPARPDDDRGVPSAATTARSDTVPPRATADAPAQLPPPASADGVPPAAPPRQAGQSPGRAPGAPPPGEPFAAVPAASGQGQSGSDAPGDSAQTGSPKAAPAGNPGAGQSGGGQGSAASGAPEPKPGTTGERPPARPKPTKARPPAPQQPAKPSESAGAPAGASRGSGRMAAVGNPRQDHNRGQERDDDPEVEDEPIEDETDEQEQRGGVMPMRRGDQRPAARELSISGDGPPDQGRGGPTPPKKARGTASLVLGQKLPDAVRGQPNPGTAKTTLEQIPPRPTAAPAGLATPAPAGRRTTPQSRRHPHALGDLVSDYHALLRAAEGAAEPARNPR